MSRYTCPRVKTTLTSYMQKGTSQGKTVSYNKAIKHEQQSRNVHGRYRLPGLGCSKQGYNTGLVQNFNSAMKT